MTQETLKMSKRERERARVMVEVVSERWTLARGAREMGVSVRQAIRIKNRYLSNREAGLLHRSRDRVSNRRKPDAFRQEVLALYRERYRDFGPTLAAEKMAELDGVIVHPETLRLWLKTARLWQGKHNAREHRKQRQRRERFGELVQIDGSDHAWFEARGPRCTLMVMVDDAKGRVVLHMAPAETTQAALSVLRRWVGLYGVPQALYADRKSVYFSPGDSDKTTEFGQVARRLEIELIRAHSPQAKGRVERMNGTLQDRLVKELRLRDISTIEGANAMLDAFAADLNRRFERAAMNPCDAHRVAPSDPMELDDLFRIEYSRVVTRDNTYAFESRRWQILEQPGAPAPGTTVRVCRALDGSLSCRHSRRTLEVCQTGSPPSPAPKHSASGRRVKAKRAPLAPEGGLDPPALARAEENRAA